MDVQDQLNLGPDKAFTKNLQEGGNSNSETLVLSCKVIKYNKRNRAQERNFALTTQAVYNLSGRRLKRRIALSSLKGITKSRAGDQFILHVPVEYDYRFSSPIHTEIINNITSTYSQKGLGTLLIWETNEMNLKDHATTKSDKKKGLNKLPPPESAINYPGRTGASPAKAEERKDTRPARSRTIYVAQNNSREATLEDFTILKVVGRGSFGKVMLVQKKDTKLVYAMKSLRKDALIEKDQIEHTLTERQIMMHANHPFLVKLEYAFATTDKIFFVMSYMRGGELFYHLRENKKFPEPRARFYACQIALALGHLHSSNIVYRDLKPENILMDDQGNVYLTDFGMAKFLPENGSTNSFCGTPEYLAPEIIACRGHGITADWWSYGILLYEMMVGIPPFYNQNVQLMYELIQHGELKFPTRQPLSPEAQDIIMKLLDRNPARRLGANGVEEIKSHPYFRGVNWEDVLSKRIEPPFKPRITSTTSTDYFDEEFTSEDPVNSVIPENRLRMIAAHQEKFKDFQ